MEAEIKNGGPGSIADARRAMYRQQILAAAEVEFAAAGFADTKMSAIAQSAGLALATVYKHCEGKAEIWDELHSVRMAELLTESTLAGAGIVSPFELLMSGVVSAARYLAEHDAYLDLNLRAAGSWASASSQAHGVQHSVWSAGLEMITSGVSAAIAQGEMRELRPGIVAGLIVSALQVWLSDWVASGRDRPAAEVIAEIDGYLRRTLEPTPSR